MITRNPALVTVPVALELGLFLDLAESPFLGLDSLT